MDRISYEVSFIPEENWFHVLAYSYQMKLKSEGIFSRLLRPCYNLLVSTPATFEKPDRATRSVGQQDAGTTWPQEMAASKIPVCLASSLTAPGTHIGTVAPR